MKVIIDADACPVKDIVTKETREKNIDVVLVSSLSHFSSRELDSHVKAVYVDAGPDAADYKIVQLAEAGDIIVTQDYGLASLLLPKGCTVLHHTGFEYNKMNMDHMLETRHMSSVIRRGGGRTKGPKALSQDDKQKFTDLFIDALNK
ncbi:YaiI/YqxD family protein [Jeotgalicoccus psychrophilus]|uniref:YaiI/YqxD family protein n=1 Tax=Jeotgalicoccus psychrophilus TaxID=157228 RepID=UPI000421A876|nr:YaiI/YqxD family protein [Jeotgalicoccus psychrophilus]